ncbi:hypothetical protein Lal_00043195 [Lupinus albus]|nr:hypothetical protein Lal_00043195 [Lupinus albus]
MYATLGQWDEVARVRKLMRDRGVKKEPGCSWVEVENMIHVFLVDDAVHPEVQEVYMYLEQLIWNLNIKSMPCPPMPCVAAMWWCAAAAVCCGGVLRQCSGVLRQCIAAVRHCVVAMVRWCGEV